MVNEQGADLNKVDYFGRTALHVASGIKDSLHVVEYLTKQPIFLDQLDSSGRSALFIALKSGSEEVVSHLQAKGATAIASDQKWAKILCIVGFEGDLQKLKLLHRCEVNLEISDYDLRHVGHLAACEGHVEMLKFLITDTTFNFDLKDRWGNSAFDELKKKVAEEDYEKLRLLLSQRKA